MQIYIVFPYFPSIWILYIFTGTSYVSFSSKAVVQFFQVHEYLTLNLHRLRVVSWRNQNMEPISLKTLRLEQVVKRLTELKTSQNHVNTATINIIVLYYTKYTIKKFTLTKMCRSKKSVQKQGFSGDDSPLGILPQGIIYEQKLI